MYLKMHHCCTKRYILGLGHTKLENNKHFRQIRKCCSEFAKAGCATSRNHRRLYAAHAWAYCAARRPVRCLPPSPRAFHFTILRVVSHALWSTGPPGTGKIRKIWWVMADDGRKTVACPHLSSSEDDCVPCCPRRV